MSRVSGDSGAKATSLGGARVRWKRPAPVVHPGRCLGAPASNLTGPNFTPPVPAYPSGHGGFGGALFQMLRHFYGTDSVPFTFVSEEFNGTTLDNQGNGTTHVFLALGGRRGERTEPDLSGHPLVVRQDVGYHAGPPYRGHVFENVLRPVARQTR